MHNTGNEADRATAMEGRRHAHRMTDKITRTYTHTHTHTHLLHSAA